MKEIGYKIKLKAMEYIRMQMAQNMKETGRVIYKTDMELKLGKMEANTKVFIKKEKNTDKENIHGQIKATMKVAGKIMI